MAIAKEWKVRGLFIYNKNNSIFYYLFIFWMGYGISFKNIYSKKTSK